MNDTLIRQPVLVTGAAGFIGSTVVRCLSNNGISVLAGQRKTRGARRYARPARRHCRGLRPQR